MRLAIIILGALFLVVSGAIRDVAAQSTRLAEIKDVDFEDVGSDGFVLERATNVTIRVTGLDPEQSRPLATSAWILDAATRTPVWIFDAGEAHSESRLLVESEESVELGAGSYEVYFASFVDWGEKWEDVRGIADVVRNVVDEIFDRDHIGWNDWEESYEDARDDLGVGVFSDGRGHNEPNADVLAEDFLATAFLTITGVENNGYAQEGFILKRPMNVEVYAIGEMLHEEPYDYAWIVDANTRSKVWTMTFDNSEPAGGARKNRMARENILLDEGRYAAYVVTDGSHSAEEWNAPPPFDPDFWGLTLRVVESDDIRNVSRYEYENISVSNAIVALRGFGDDQHRSEGFTLSQPMAVRIYALGEGRDGEMFDYAWIVDADTRRRVWSMDYYDTEHAGGAQKNRVFDGVVSLPRGNYVVHFVTDDSHSYRSWNMDPPYDAAAWGVTVVPALSDFDGSMVSSYDQESDKSILARVTEVRDDAHRRQHFSLGKDTKVRIYAVGEGMGGDMFDYGWIEDSKSGRVVWEMTYGMTEPAGGAEKNREVNTVMMLPEGDYEAHFRTDGSHAFGQWNARPPFEQESWGLTVSLAE
jgi:hypothetical protein